ncbi:zinc-binding alcohol dehydrogenase family protein [Maricaulis sp.]|uniref:zinc-binding alcohol dehydrogenase family protein n=1 Tax=Maricaulis sp. TaxID=1486257 RepID=UPI003A8EE309
MQAIGYETAGPVDAPQALTLIDVPRPLIGPRDLLVEVRGISVNPVDVKLRAGVTPEGGPRILGFDAAGIVVETGAEVSGYAVGDEVFYAGDLTRPGSNAQFQAVDERIVGRKPASLDFTEAAGLPLTSITAWEMLFDSFRIAEGSGTGDSLLVIGGAGGVGSILIQLAKRLTGLTVIATASRPQTRDWVTKMGADHVIDHRQSMPQQLAELGLEPRYVAALTGTEGHFAAILELIAPRGHIALIDDPATLDILAAKVKALTVSWEFMFTRSMFAMADISAQRDLLDRVSAMIDAGQLISTVTERAGPLDVEHLRAAHARQESGRVIGKQVLDGFAPARS